MKKHSFTAVIGENTEAKVKFTFSPGRPAKIYGDEPYPEEEPEIEIYEVMANGGDFINDLNEECLLTLEEEAGEYLSSLRR